jgi:GAF domain-containing protein
VHSGLSGALTDPGRLAALHQTRLLDTPAEAVFDRLARLAARLLDVPIALMSLIDQDRQFFKASVGLPEPWASARETPVSHSMCRRVLTSGQPLVVRDARWDELAQDNRFMGELGAVAYLGIPLLLSSGHVLGSFCVVDRRPRDWTGDDVASLTDLAVMVMDEIELRVDLEARELADAARSRRYPTRWRSAPPTRTARAPGSSTPTGRSVSSPATGPRS